MIVVANLLSPTLNDLTYEICVSLKSTLDREGGFTEAGVEDFLRGRVGVALICGLAYTLLSNAAPDRFVPIAAPIVDDHRVTDMPVYFSEIVVSAGNPAASIEDLRGTRFAYNEEVSFSGYRALEHKLKTAGLSWDFFEQRIRTGSHRGSVSLVAEGKAGAAAIDSHALLLEKHRDPTLAARIRVVASLGPYPAPPVVINRDGCDLSANELRELLYQLPKSVLRAAGINRWQSVDDDYYDAIRVVTEGMPGLVLEL